MCDVRNVIFEREVQYQLAKLKRDLLLSQGEEKASGTIKYILNALDNLGMFSSVGKNIRDTYNIDCPSNWFLLYVDKNYFVYSKTEKLITILKMYSNKQDFIYDLFGIEMRSEESKKYWGD